MDSGKPRPLLAWVLAVWNVRASVCLAPARHCRASLRGAGRVPRRLPRGLKATRLPSEHRYAMRSWRAASTLSCSSLHPRGSPKLGLPRPCPPTGRESARPVVAEALAGWTVRIGLLAAPSRLRRSCLARPLTHSSTRRLTHLPAYPLTPSPSHSPGRAPGPCAGGGWRGVCSKDLA